MDSGMTCRHCHAQLPPPFIDLGYAPPSNAYRTRASLSQPEVHYPLRVAVCHTCWLAQTEDYARADELFDEHYAYFSSTSAGWVAHAARFADSISTRLQLTPRDLVVEVACNDGYLLQHFTRLGIPCLGIEPTASTAAAAERLGIEVRREFFGASLGQRLANTGRLAALIVANNVLAHVPDINDFVEGLRLALAPDGTVSLEFPHLLQLLRGAQFDTIYHEHFSYLSLGACQRILERTGLRIIDVEPLPTHGGSLRVLAAHKDDKRPTQPTVHAALDEEVAAGLFTPDSYASLQSQAQSVATDLLRFLVEQKRAGRTVMGYGAAAKGNTLLNYAGVRPFLLGAVFDAAPSKQGWFLPGSHIPVLPPALIPEMRPDVLLILPWNIADEVRQQQAGIAAWGGRFAVAIPTLTLW
jgi:SAM-dependent methyltransferase